MQEMYEIKSCKVCKRWKRLRVVGMQESEDIKSYKNAGDYELYMQEMYEIKSCRMQGMYEIKSYPVAIEPSVDCDFGEAEICYYTHDPTANFNWEWTNRATDSSFTGPAQDHTRGDELGFYVHIDSVYQRPGSKSRLISPLINAPQRSSCLEFWFHMYGSHIGQLNVYFKYNDSALPDKPAWSLSGNQGNTCTEHLL
ncbi:MAM domain-containing glycosylphosphatidylinositol anchor protein 2-like [Strongylocentrotus purpuratus]|uniref:MAM domain-containing protein n=1 Tax=Strongylocentrotus purpuratus TaxID=7668 RepID=A0A7M7NJS6_STRPU|nr:MAM domain-containing glycosylphosphatidylinositol anchor protein 2-like [Strongylocentrotus purpuratus]